MCSHCHIAVRCQSTTKCQFNTPNKQEVIQPMDQVEEGQDIVDENEVIDKFIQASDSNIPLDALKNKCRDKIVGLTQHIENCEDHFEIKRVYNF
jgi:hypothetical protein